MQPNFAEEIIIETLSEQWHVPTDSVGRKTSQECGSRRRGIYYRSIGDVRTAVRLSGYAGTVADAG